MLFEFQGKADFDIVCEILSEYGIKVIDVADIWVPKPGSVWITPTGDNHHAKKLRRLAIGMRRPEHN